MNKKQLDKITEHKIQLQFILNELSEIENNTKLSEKEKLSKIQIIRKEISKVATEIDKIKKELILKDTINTN